MSELEMRRATEADLPTVIELQSQSTPSSLERAVPIFRRMASYPNYGIYLAFQDGHAVGTLALLIMDNLGHMGAPIAVVENVVVDRNRRRHGIGRQMMEFARRTASELGCYKMILASNRKLEAAHEFYQSLGFEWQGYTFSLDL